MRLVNWAGKTGAGRTKSGASGSAGCSRSEAGWFFKTHLADGPLPAKQVVAAASTAGWSAGQVRRAREAQRVVCSQETTANGQWVWELRNRPERAVAGLVKLNRKSSGLGIESVEDGKDVEDAVTVSAYPG